MEGKLDEWAIGGIKVVDDNNPGALDEEDLIGSLLDGAFKVGLLFVGLKVL